jgi:hypothetical protein
VQSTGKGLATNVNMRGLDVPQIEELAQLLFSSGFRHVRQEITWSEVEANRGTYDWSSYEQMIGILGRNGLTTIAVVVDTPDWARGIGEVAASNAPPRDPAMLANLSANLTQTFGDAVGFVQLWDAPNVSDNWGNRVATGMDYAPYLEAFLREPDKAMPTPGC